MSTGIKVKDEFIDPDYEKILSGAVKVKSEPQDIPEDFFDDFENNKFLDELVDTVVPDSDDVEPVRELEPVSDGELRSEDEDSISQPGAPPSVPERTRKSPIRAPSDDEGKFLEEPEDAAIKADIERLTRNIERRKIRIKAAEIKKEKVLIPRKRSPSPFTRRIKLERVTPEPSTSRQRSRSRSLERRRSRSPHSATRRRSRSPHSVSGRRLSRSPNRRRISPVGLRSPTRKRTRSPVPDRSLEKRNRSPLRRSRSPAMRMRSPASSHSRSPTRRPRSPGRLRSPSGRSRSPTRRQRSPLGRLRSPTGRSRSPIAGRVGYNRDIDFQKERERLLASIRANNPAAQEKGRVANMDLATIRNPLASTSATLRLMPQPVKIKTEPVEVDETTPATLRLMPQPVRIKTESIDVDDPVLEVPIELPELPTAKRIKTEIISTTPLSHSEKVSKFCKETLRNFQVFEKSIQQKRRFLFTPTALVRKRDNNLNVNRSPLNQNTTVHYQFNSVSLSIDTEKWGIRKLSEETAKIVNLLGFNANLFIDRLKTNATTNLHSDIPDELRLGQSSCYTDAETQTNELKCNKCIIRKLIKHSDQAVQVSLMPSVVAASPPPPSVSQQSFDPISEPILHMMSQLMPVQLSALKNFAELIQGPAPGSITERNSMREKLMDIFTLGQQSQGSNNVPSNHGLTIPTIPSPSNQMFNQRTSQSIQPQPVPSPYQQQQHQPSLQIHQPYRHPPPVGQPHQRINNNMLPGMNHRFPYSHVNNHVPLQAVHANYVQPNINIPLNIPLFPGGNIRPMRSDDPRMSRYHDVNHPM